MSVVPGRLAWGRGAGKVCALHLRHDAMSVPSMAKPHGHSHGGRCSPYISTRALQASRNNRREPHATSSSFSLFSPWLSSLSQLAVAMTVPSSCHSVQGNFMSGEEVQTMSVDSNSVQICGLSLGAPFAFYLQAFLQKVRKV